MPDRVLLAFLLGPLLCSAISSLSFAGEAAPPAQSLPGVFPPDKDSGVQVTAKPGKGVTVTSSDGNYELNLYAYLQFLYHFTAADGGDDSSDFRILRGRTVLQGHAFHPWLEYRVQYELAGTAALRDFYLDLTRCRWASFRFGQFKVSYSLQQITHDPRLQFPNREITDEVFAPGRDQGVSLHGQSGKGFFGYDAGVFNGDGINQAETAKPNTDHLVAVRVHLDPRGEYPVTETAPQAPDHLLWTVGIGGLANKVPATSTLPRFDREGTNLYAGIKVGRFSGTGELFRERDDTTDTALSPDLKARGFYVQAGVYLIPGRLEVAGRVANVDPDLNKAQNDKRVGRVGLNLYFDGHEQKLQFDLGQVRYDRSNPELLQAITAGQRSLQSGLDDATDTEARILYQAIF